MGNSPATSFAKVFCSYIAPSLSSGNHLFYKVVQNWFQIIFGCCPIEEITIYVLFCPSNHVEKKGALSIHSSVKEPYSPGREAEVARPSLTRQRRDSPSECVNPWSELYHLQRSSVLVGQRKHERSQFYADYMKCRHHCFLLFIFHLFTNELSYDNVPYLPDIIIIMKNLDILV